MAKLPAEWVRVATKKYTYVLDLELRYAESAAQLSEFDRVRKENAALRALLEYEQASGAAKPRQRKIASVLSYAQPTISVGQDDGIQEGYLVFVHGVFIGKISKVSAHEAQVKLLAAFSDTDVILVQTEVGVTGLVSGDGRDVVMREIPIDAAIQVGQRIESSGQVGVLPQLYMGRIVSIRRNEGSPTQTAVIDPGVSFYNTSIVEVSP
jgi:cell shape-determining protein MreC